MVNTNKSPSFSNGKPCQQSFTAVFYPKLLLGDIGLEDIVLKYQTSLPEQFICDDEERRELISPVSKSKIGCKVPLFSLCGPDVKVKCASSSRQPNTILLKWSRATIGSEWCCISEINSFVTRVAHAAVIRQR